MVFDKLQNIGKALMTPVAVLPAAGLLLRLGAEDVLDIVFLEKAGGAMFDSLPVLFAIGIAFGISKDNHGAAALSGFVGYTVLTSILKSVNENIDMGVLAGIVTGLTAGALYDRYHRVKLPDYLGFFGGTRFVPIITLLSSIILAVIFSYIWIPIQETIRLFGEVIINAGATGAFIYGFFNRLLIPFGLHHILNSFVWFVFGEYTNPETGAVVTGDLNRFFAGDPYGGAFMSGFFPVFMFGLPAVCLAIYKTALPENRKKISGMLISIAFTSFLTGITEPIEFMFMFLAPGLYLIHAIFTGMSMALAHIFGVKEGFGFSAGVIDYVLNWKIATNPELIIPIGLFMAFIYHYIFKSAIIVFDLPMWGRSDDEITDDDISEEERISKIIENLGGKDNFVTIGNCATRLRLTLKNAEMMNEDELKKLGAMGIVRQGNAVQIVIGTQVEHLARDMKDIVGK